MTINDLITNVKSKVQPSVDADAQEIAVWLQEQFYYAISFIQEYNPRKFNKVIEINILNGVQEYELPVDFLTVKKVEINYFDQEKNLTLAVQLDPIDFDQIENIAGDNQLAAGQRYYVRDRNIGIYPKPKLNSLQKIRIYYYYEPAFNDANLNKLPVGIQLSLCNGAVATYLSRDMEYGAANNQAQIHEKKLKQLCKVFAKDDRNGPKNLINEQTRFGYHNRFATAPNVGEI